MSYYEIQRFPFDGMEIMPMLFITFVLLNIHSSIKPSNNNSGELDIPYHVKTIAFQMIAFSLVTTGLTEIWNMIYHPWIPYEHVKPIVDWLNNKPHEGPIN